MYALDKTSVISCYSLTNFDGSTSRDLENSHKLIYLLNDPNCSFFETSPLSSDCQHLKRQIEVGFSGAQQK